ncbi:DsbC family protein [Parvibium lacunae]|uniref:Thiol:disulfide interchange protein n=1 Tax=Parvibium lacunae TaxID=1888893 RepID=A0A368L4V2_9BURK|nr:DsbC family protein [Parvibium lacunae]RCS58604.1 DsbC family protein [Parvibium lacunae]
MSAPSTASALPRYFLCTLLCLSSGLGWAQSPTQANAASNATNERAPTPTPAVTLGPVEARLKKTFEERDNFKVESVIKTPYLGLYEVRVGNEIFYTDDKGEQFIIGEIIDAKRRVNLTQQRIAELQRIKFSDLPLELAVKNVRGNGKQVIAVFEDPNCGYCKRFQKTLSKLDNLTVYTFLIGILAPDSRDKAQSILCAKDRNKVHLAWMLDGTTPPATKCEGAFTKSMELARKLGVESTPTLYFADGRRVAGAIPQNELEKILAELK